MQMLQQREQELKDQLMTRSGQIEESFGREAEVKRKLVKELAVQQWKCQ